MLASSPKADDLVDSTSRGRRVIECAANWADWFHVGFVRVYDLVDAN